MNACRPVLWWNLKEAPERIGVPYETLRKSIQRSVRRMPGGVVEARVHGILARKFGVRWLATSGEKCATARQAYSVEEAAAILGKSPSALRAMFARNPVNLRRSGIRGWKLPSKRWRVEFGSAWTTPINTAELQAKVA